MRKVIAAALVLGLAIVGAPLTAAAQATLKGNAQGADRKPLSNYTIQVRNVKTGSIAGTTTSSAAGDFTFSGLDAGDYVIEVVNAAGKVVALSPQIAVATGATVSVSVTGTAAQSIIASKSGLSLFGLGKGASFAVISAAGVATVSGIIVAKKDASPSR